MIHYPNLQSLEFILRAFLLKCEELSGVSFPQSGYLHKLREGETVPKNAFTNYDTLGKLIHKYNNNDRIQMADLTVDDSLAQTRDALAHGRVSGLKPYPPLRLLKFRKPKNSQVELELSILMTEEWFKENISKVYKAISTVHEALGSQLNRIPISPVSLSKSLTFMVKTGIP